MLLRKIEVEVIYDARHKDLKEVLPVGFETELSIWGRDEDLHEKPYYTRNDKNELVFCQGRGLLYKKGDYHCATFVGANGKTYGNSWLEIFLGPKPFDFFFKKLSENITKKE